MVAIEKDPRADEAIRRWDELKSERSHHEGDWDEIARLMRGPARGGFTSADPSLMRNAKALTSLPIIAQTSFAASLYGTMTNPANRWMGFSIPDQDLAQYQPVKLWLDAVSRITLASFRPSVSTFYTNAMPFFSDIACFGNAAQYDEARPSEGKILDLTLSMAEIVWEIDAFGRVVGVIRKTRLSPVAAARWFGIDNLPTRMAQQAKDGVHEKRDFYQHVRLNDDWEPRRLGPRGKRWVSLHIAADDRAVIREGGYDDMPFDAARWEVDTGQTYGYGPGSVALPDVRMANRMDDANMRSAQFAADPTKLAPDRESWPISGVVRPGSTIYGGVNARGERMIHTLDRSSGTGLTIEMYQQRLNSIREAFHNTLLSLTSRTGVTEVEALEYQEQRLRLQAPNMGRVQEEYLAPKTARRFAMLWKAKQLPPPPPELGGMPLDVEYLSAAAMAQKSAEGAAIIRLANDIAPLAQLKPRLMERLAEDDYLEALQEARGVPARVIKSREQADEETQQRQQQQQMAGALEMAQSAGGAMRDMAQAVPAEVAA